MRRGKLYPYGKCQRRTSQGHQPAEGKTSYVEQIGVDGRSIMLKEYRVDDTVVYAGYSSRSETVYLSLC